MLYRMRKTAGDYKAGEAVAALGVELTEAEAKKCQHRVAPSRIASWLRTGHVGNGPAAKPAPEPPAEATQGGSDG
jgi:hypothetical protein